MKIGLLVAILVIITAGFFTYFLGTLEAKNYIETVSTVIVWLVIATLIIAKIKKAGLRALTPPLSIPLPTITPAARKAKEEFTTMVSNQKIHIKSFWGRDDIVCLFCGGGVRHTTREEIRKCASSFASIYNISPSKDELAF